MADSRLGKRFRTYGLFCFNLEDEVRVVVGGGTLLNTLYNLSSLFDLSGCIFRRKTLCSKESGLQESSESN